jgi:hypothetical protein
MASRAVYAYRAWSIYSAKDAEDGDYDLRMLIPDTEAATEELPAYIGKVKTRMVEICALVGVFRGTTGMLKLDGAGPSDLFAQG